ncbi:MAG: N-acetyl sugar amidotransferase, partial [Actinobacteria bacterium]|nr:N-acetyl sugar amidotransferase [Actinomycetota bacterium]
MSDTEYQICTRCIMDTSDPDITFDENGVCNHCHAYDRLVEADGYKPGTSEKQLEDLVATMKEAGKGNEYDCVLGISGGVDSSYMALLAKQLGLRVLAVHVDAGWNSELAVDNIQKMCSALDYDLHTVVVDWPAIKELQRAYMFSGLANLDIPQDHAF